jgi:hypothetical protein
MLDTVVLLLVLYGGFLLAVKLLTLLFAHIGNNRYQWLEAAIVFGVVILLGVLR